MILVDTSIWIDHIRSSDAMLSALLTARQVTVHPFVLGELALGTASVTSQGLLDLASLPSIVMMQDADVLRAIRSLALSGSGIGYVDAHLVLSVAVSIGHRLWTRDKRLHAVATRLNVAYEATPQ